MTMRLSDVLGPAKFWNPLIAGISTYSSKMFSCGKGKHAAAWVHVTFLVGCCPLFVKILGCEDEVDMTSIRKKDESLSCAIRSSSDGNDAVTGSGNVSYLKTPTFWPFGPPCLAKYPCERAPCFLLKENPEEPLMGS